MSSRIACLCVLIALAGVASAASSTAFDPELVEVDADAKISVPIYGEWCGPGYPGPGKNPKPIDAVDSACMVHDHCYSSRGYFDCQCNKDLTNTLSRIKCSGSCERNRLLIMGVFKGIPCACRGGSCKVGPFSIPAKNFMCMPNLCHQGSPRFASKKPSSRRGSKQSKPSSKASGSSGGSAVDTKTKQAIKTAVDKELSSSVLKSAKDSVCAGTAFKNKKGKSALFVFEHSATDPKAQEAAKQFQQKMTALSAQLNSCPAAPATPPPGQRGGSGSAAGKSSSSKGKKKRF